MANQFQADALRQIQLPQTTRVIAVCSGKGGVGKTNVAANLAVALGQKGHRVDLLDADVSLANVDVLFGLQPRFNLSHVVSGEVTLQQTLLDGPANIRIIPASSGNFDMSKLDARGQATLIQAFSDLASQPDYLIVDTAAGISPTVAAFVKAATHPIVVLRDEPSSLTDAYALIKVFSKHYRMSRFQILTNQSSDARSGKHLYNKLATVTDNYLDVVLRHVGDIPDDKYLRKAVQHQRAVVDAFPRSASGQAFTRAAASVAKLPVSTQPNGGIQFYLEQLVMGDRTYKGKVA